MADILLAAELENEMAEMAEGEGDDEQDYEDDMADVCFFLLFLLMSGWQMLRDPGTGGPRKVRVFSERKEPQHTQFCRET